MIAFNFSINTAHTAHENLYIPMLTHAPIFKNLNLLFVDDNIDVSASAYQLLSSCFKVMYLASNVDNALKFYREKDIDLIITDIKMPNNDGLSLVKEVRKDDCHTAVIILTAFTDTDYLLRAANLQIDAYITKPLNFPKLNTALDAAIKRIEWKLQPIKLTEETFYHSPTKKLTVKGEEVSLGHKECLLLELLLFSKNRIVQKSEINDIVWSNQDMTDAALKNLLGELRRKLQCDVIKNQPARGWYIEL